MRFGSDAPGTPCSTSRSPITRRIPYQLRRPSLEPRRPLLQRSPPRSDQRSAPRRRAPQRSLRFLRAPQAGRQASTPLRYPRRFPGPCRQILATLRTRTDQIRNLIDKGLFGEVYVPAFQAKDLAVALETREILLPEDRRQKSEAALATLVRDAYLLDAFGDLGNKQQISDAYADFAAAAKDIQSSLSETRP